MPSPFSLLIRVYQRAVSPLLPASCRFYPSCSSYAIEAIDRHGNARGLALAARRLSRCHPWNPGGVDQVPGTTISPDKPTNGTHHG